MPPGVTVGGDTRKPNGGKRMSIGGWQIVILAVIFLGVVCIPAVAIATDKSDQSMQRQGWWVWTGICAAFVFVIVRSLLEQQAGPVAQWVFWGLTVIFVLVLPGLLARPFLWRVRDAGWNPKLAYLFIVPVIMFIPWFLLLFLPTRERAQEKVSDQ